MRGRREKIITKQFNKIEVTALKDYSLYMDVIKTIERAPMKYKY